MSKHSKGPWSIETATDGELRIVAEGAAVWPIARLHGGMSEMYEEPGIPEQMANARLINAAPELREKLQTCYELIKGSLQVALVSFPDYPKANKDATEAFLDEIQVVLSIIEGTEHEV